MYSDCVAFVCEMDRLGGRVRGSERFLVTIAMVTVAMLQGREFFFTNAESSVLL